MTFMVTFKVDANPVGKQRARYVKRGNFIQTYTPEKTRTYETLIKEAAREAMGSSEPLETPVSLVHLNTKRNTNYAIKYF